MQVNHSGECGCSVISAYSKACLILKFLSYLCMQEYQLWQSLPPGETIGNMPPKLYVSLSLCQKECLSLSLSLSPSLSLSLSLCLSVSVSLSLFVSPSLSLYLSLSLCLLVSLSLFVSSVSLPLSLCLSLSLSVSVSVSVSFFLSLSLSLSLCLSVSHLFSELLSLLSVSLSLSFFFFSLSLSFFFSLSLSLSLSFSLSLSLSLSFSPGRSASPYLPEFLPEASCRQNKAGEACLTLVLFFGSTLAAMIVLPGNPEKLAISSSARGHRLHLDTLYIAPFLTWFPGCASSKLAIQGSNAALPD